MLHLSQHAEADKLLSESPLALLIGLVLDQQIPLEKAFRSPLDLKERLGGRLDVGEIAAMDPDVLAKVFSIVPALHRFPASMAARTQELCRVIENDYQGDAAQVWSKASSGRELLANLKGLPGFGDQKARIFVAFLGKQLGVGPRGWKAVSEPFGQTGTYRSIADIDGPEALLRVRAYKTRMKAKAKATATATADTRTKANATADTKAETRARVT
ncbi:MAG: HhH-GPD-type base excision DNA repair protein [Acidimicrobiales bacterium]